MTFTDFHSFAQWCIHDVEAITVEEYKQNEQSIAIVNLHNTPGMAVAELMVVASDSGFHFGPMLSGMFDGTIVIYADE